jgi:hypothetical protein
MIATDVPGQPLLAQLLTALLHEVCKAEATEQQPRYMGASPSRRTMEYTSGTLLRAPAPFTWTAETIAVPEQQGMLLAPGLPAPNLATRRPVGRLRRCIRPLEHLAVSRLCRWCSFLQVQGACTGSSSRP